MKKFTIICALLILIINFVACTDQEYLENTVEEMKADSFHISLEEALKTAEAFFTQLDTPMMRSVSNGRELKSVIMVQLNPVMRSSIDEVDGVLYLVNYKDDKGFALLGADRRLAPIYAISDSGSLYMQDTLENKPLAMFFQGVKYSLAAASTNPSVSTSELYNGYKILKNAQVSPLLSVGARQWGQDAPYNQKCKVIDGKHALAGCLAVSIGQIMSYYKWPQYAGDDHLLWRPMNKGTNQSHVASLFSWLGQEDLLNMNYGLEKSTAEESTIPRTFVQMGYKFPDSFKNFKATEIIEVLDSAKNKVKGAGPLLMLTTTEAYGRHAWVIDGYAKNVIDNTNIGTKMSISHTYFHCVWGLNGGKGNGYYYIKSTREIDSDNAAAIDINDYWSDLRFAGKIPKCTKVQYMTNFIPDK